MKKALIFLWLCIASTVSFGQNIKISQIFNLQTSLNAKANLASPTFIGSPKAPTQTAGDNSTNLATTAYVDGLTTYFATGLFSGAGTSGSPYGLGTGIVGLSNLSATGTASSSTFLRGDNSWFNLFTGTNTYTGVNTFNANGIATTATTTVSFGNSTASTNTITAQYGGGTDYVSNGWNTTTPGNDVLHMQLYNKPSSGSITFSTLNLDVWTNSGSHVSAWSVNSLGQMFAGQIIISGQIAGNTFVLKPSSSSAINSTATATAAQVASQVITSTSAAATSITLPSASAILTQLNGTAKSWFPLRVDNVAGASAVTIVLPGTITSGSTGTPLTVAIGTAAMYEIFWPTTTSAIIYRVGQ